MSNLLGPVFAGYLYDVTGQWYLTFGLGGLFIALSGALLVLMPLCGPKKGKKGDDDAEKGVEKRKKKLSEFLGEVGPQETVAVVVGKEAKAEQV